MKTLYFHKIFVDDPDDDSDDQEVPELVVVDPLNDKQGSLKIYLRASVKRLVGEIE